MRLNPEELQISSFETLQAPAELAELAAEGSGPHCDPTPMTLCYYCTPTEGCPTTE